MSFVTNKYTINLLMSEVQSLTSSQVSSFDSIVEALSPRAGVRSAKIAALSSYVGGSVARVLGNTSLGRTPRARLLKALRNRKTSGSAA